MPAILSPKKLRFAQEYVVDRNATQAAIRAGYSEKTAYSQGERLLKKVEVKTEIVKLSKEVVKKNNLTSDRLVREYKSLAYSNITNYLNEDGTIALNQLKTLPKHLSAAIESVQTSTTTNPKTGEVTVNVKIKLYSKTTALEAIAKHLGWFEKDNLQQPASVINIQPPVIINIQRDARKENPTIDITPIN